MKTINAKLECIPEGVEYIREQLHKEKNLPSKQLNITLLTMEDLIADMITNSAEGTKISIRTYKIMGELKIHLDYRGERFEPSLLSGLGLESLSEEEEDEDTYAAIQNIVKKAFQSTFSYHYNRGKGRIEYVVRTSEYKQLYATVTCIVLGIIAGFVLRLLPKEISGFIAGNVFKTAYTLFLNAIKMVVGPLVLFSIASSVAGFDNIRSLGKLGTKVFFAYCFTSLIALFVGLGVYMAHPVGNPELIGSISDAGASVIEKAGAVEAVSLKGLLISIVPTNIITALANSDMLQIIFFSILLGIACTNLGEYRSSAQTGLNILNDIFSKITALIVGFMPVAMFCSMAILIANTSAASMLSLLGWLVLIYCADFIMLIVYGIGLTLLGKVNPLIFFRKIGPLMVNAYSFASSNAVLPMSMETAGKKLGIHRRIYSFSLPLGSTINMDGSCITLIITVLFMAKVFGIEVGSSMLISLFITIMALSIGSPGVPGGNLVCITMLLPQYGIPVEAVSLIVGLYSLISSIQTTVNSTGDLAITTVLASWEKLIDKDIYTNAIEK